MLRISERNRNTLVAMAVSSVAVGLGRDPAAAQNLPRATSDRPATAQAGTASFYSQREAGKPTASGAPLALNRMTAASPTLPLGTRAKVVNVETGRTAHVTITDRGPYAKGRVLDVTPKAAERLGITKKDGVAPVVIEPVSGPASPRK